MIARKIALISVLLVGIILFASSASAPRFFLDEDVQNFACGPRWINEGEDGTTPMAGRLLGNFQSPGEFFDGAFGIPKKPNDPCGLYGQVLVSSVNVWVCIQPGNCCRNDQRPGLYDPFDIANWEAGIRYDEGGRCTPNAGAFLDPRGLPHACKKSCPGLTGLDLVTLGITTADPDNIQEIMYKRLINRYNMDPFFGLDPALVGSEVSFPFLNVQKDRKLIFTVNVANLGTKSNDVDVPVVAYYGFCNDPTNPLARLLLPRPLKTILQSPLRQF